jgi:hypothetical protein
VFLQSVLVEMYFLWGQILQAALLVRRPSHFGNSGGAITTYSEGEKSAERNVPSGWLARVTF